MATVSDAQKRASAKYEREKTRSIKIKLTISTDADILAKLDSEDNYVLMGHSEEARREALLNLICF